MLSPLFSLVPVLLQSQSPAAHEAFRDDADSDRAAYLEGREMAKRRKTSLDVLKAASKDVGTVRSPKGAKWAASSAALLTPRTLWRTIGVEDARSYRDGSAALASLDRAPKPPTERTIDLIVTLNAWPGIHSLSRRVLRAAKESDVKDVGFVLLVDGDPKRPVHPLVAPEMVGADRSEGTISTRTLDRFDVETRSSGVAYGPSGSVFARSVGSARSSVTYASWKEEGFDAYRAVWTLRFPLYGTDLAPNVPESARTLVLKVIRPTTEASVAFDLSAFVK